MEHYFFSTVKLKTCTGMCNIFILSTLYRLHYLPPPNPSLFELQKSTLPWRPLLSYHSGADSHDRDMIGVSYHRIATHLWYSGDFFDTTIVVCSQGNVKEALMHRTKSIATDCYLRASYHQYTIAMACHRRRWTTYMVYSPQLHFIGQYGPSPSSHAYIDMH